LNTKNKIDIQVPAEWESLRADKALGLHPEIRTRSRAEFLLREDLVHLDGNPLKASQKLRAGQSLEVFLPEPVASELVPLDIPLDVKFEDEDVIVVNKPAGLVIHPSPGHSQDTLVNMLIAHTDDLSMGFQEHRPGIVHRLDRDTSGLLVIAKNDQAHQALSEKFQKRDLHRIYHAITIGIPPHPTGTVQSYLARHPTDRKRNASVMGPGRHIHRDPQHPPASGRWAVTHYEVLDSLPSGVGYLKLKLETGRTHQIRVHLSEMGCPIAKDDTYGSFKRMRTVESQSLRNELSDFPRFALHARELGFHHPRTGEWMFFSANWPADLFDRIEHLGFAKWEEILKT